MSRRFAHVLRPIPGALRDRRQGGSGRIAGLFGPL